jgi:hypothetical protein
LSLQCHDLDLQGVDTLEALTDDDAKELENPPRSTDFFALWGL